MGPGLGGRVRKRGELRAVGALGGCDLSEGAWGRGQGDLWEGLGQGEAAPTPTSDLRYRSEMRLQGS